MRASGILVASICLGGCATGAVSVDDLIGRNTAARGGADALNAIGNMRVLVEITEPQFTVVGDYRARADGRMRIDIYADGARVFSEGIDAEGAWQRAGGDAPIEPASEKGAAALAHGVEFNLYSLDALRARGSRVDAAGRERLDGVDHHVLKVALPDGFETFLYVDPDSWQIARRRDVRALHPDVDPAEKLIENQYSDFKLQCGAIFAAASRQIDARTGAELQTTRLVDQECNLSEDALQIPRDVSVERPPP